MWKIFERILEKINPKPQRPETWLGGNRDLVKKAMEKHGLIPLERLLGGYGNTQGLKENINNPHFHVFAAVYTEEHGKVWWGNIDHQKLEYNLQTLANKTSSTVHIIDGRKDPKNVAELRKYAKHTINPKTLRSQ